MQYLLTHSYYAKLLAVRQVTTNKGKKTAGIDGVLWSRSSSKMQAVYALVLEPIAETTADNRSFGFRQGRCCQDACEHIFNLMSMKKYILIDFLSL